MKPVKSAPSQIHSRSTCFTRLSEQLTLLHIKVGYTNQRSASTKSLQFTDHISYFAASTLLCLTSSSSTDVKVETVQFQIQRPPRMFVMTVNSKSSSLLCYQFFLTGLIQNDILNYEWRLYRVVLKLDTIWLQ